METTYVRFGALPRIKLVPVVLEDGYTSEVREMRRSWNAREERHEKGTSVYRATKTESGYVLDMTGLDPISTMCIMDSGRDVYEVSGSEIGTGSDGEPLLADAEIVREITEAIRIA